MYRSAFAGLRDWPEGLFQFLDAFGGCNPVSPSAPIRIKCLQQMQHDWLATDWHDSPLAFVQPVLVDYLLKRRLPFLRAVVERFSAVTWFTEQTGLWTEGHTAQALGISLHDLQRFYPHGSLAKCFKPDPRTRLPMFKRDAVLAVQRRWAMGWSLEDVSSRLGVEIADVLRLVQLGLLNPVGNREKTAEANQVFDRHEVAAVFEQVDRRLKVYPGTRYYLATLDEAAREFSNCGLDRAALLQGVARGVLPGYKYQPNIHSLRQVRFVETQSLALPDLMLCRARMGGRRSLHAGKECHVSNDPESDRCGLDQPSRNAGTAKVFLAERIGGARTAGGRKRLVPLIFETPRIVRPVRPSARRQFGYL